MEQKKWFAAYFYMTRRKNKQANHIKLQRLTSLSPEEFMSLLSVFAPITEQYFQTYTLEGHARRIPKYQEDARCSLPGSLEKLKFILMYLKENPRQDYHGLLFGMQQPKVSKWVKLLLPLLGKALERMQMLPKRFGQGLYAFLATFCRHVLLMDVTEREIPRYTDHEKQKHFYSGKKKAHTVKNNLIVDQSKYILFLSSTYPGSTHDKTLADEAGHCFPRHTILVEDLGYLGFEAEGASVLMPHKKQKKATLTKLQKDENKQISQIRIPVEHLMAEVKRLNIIKEKVRLRVQNVHDQIMLVACGLHNLRNAWKAS